MLRMAVEGHVAESNRRKFENVCRNHHCTEVLDHISPCRKETLTFDAFCLSLLGEEYDSCHAGHNHMQAGRAHDLPKHGLCRNSPSLPCTSRRDRPGPDRVSVEDMEGEENENASDEEEARTLVKRKS